MCRSEEGVVKDIADLEEEVSSRDVIDQGTRVREIKIVGQTGSASLLQIGVQRLLFPTLGRGAETYFSRPLRGDCIDLLLLS